MGSVKPYRAIRWDGIEWPSPSGVHGEVDRYTGRRFVCVKADYVCFEIEPGDWILYTEDGESFPVPARFLQEVRDKDVTT